MPVRRLPRSCSGRPSRPRECSRSWPIRTSPGSCSDLAESVLPELGPRLGKAALKLVRKRGMQVRLGISVTEMSDGSVTLSDGSVVATHTVLWTVGVTPPPLVSRLALPVARGRLVVDENLLLRPNVWAAGDAAAAKDPFNRGRPRLPADGPARPAAGRCPRQERCRQPRPWHPAAVPSSRPRPGRRPRRRVGRCPTAGHPADRPGGQAGDQGLSPVRDPVDGQSLRVAADWAINLSAGRSACSSAWSAPRLRGLGSAEHTH